jgi:PAP2 superfamily
MKKTALYISALIAVACFMAPGCKKSIDGRTDGIAPLNPQNIDLDAGAWKTVLIKRPDTFAVAAPFAITSADYIAELNEIKGYQRNLTGEQASKIKYWGAGGVLRWNEIMRELVAKYNLPAYQNPDNTYPIPSSANPFAYPLFPFANPPYAARAYAYVAAAQYDALVACWYYKKLYHRQAPYKTDAGISAKVSPTDLPSYPSEAAVLAGVTAEMMKLLFPDEIAAINLKAQEQENAAIMSGAATRSDIIAGEALGRQIAEVFIARAKSDRAGKAVGTQSDWDAITAAQTAKGEIPWYSLEVPKRPPMLPLFGKVLPFLFDTLTTLALRPAAPPSTSSDQMKQETAEVYNYVKNPTRENFRIVSFWADGVGTYTPPGHWNAIAAEDFITKNFSEVRWARNMSLLNMSLMDAAIVCWNTKYYYSNPRPCQMNPDIKTLTGVPNFPSYISGHSTFSGAAATVLSYIVPERANAYNSMAQEASLSRQVAGIHYKSDCVAGLDVGTKIGNYAVNRGKTDGAN